ncbi:MAG: HAMP domain-containing sensor histidine kinase [Patescibacteria group bacterium]
MRGELLTIPKNHLYQVEHLIEAGVWLILLVIVFGVQLLPKEIIPLEDAYRIAGAIIAFALFYYYVIWKYFQPEQRRFLKDITDIIFIGMILYIAKEYSIYFFTLIFLPVAAAAFTLNLLHSLLIATSASVFIALEIILSGQGLLDESQLVLSTSPIIIFLAMTIFVRFLALQIRHEREAKLAARAEAKELAHNLAEDRKLESMEREFTNLASHQLLTPLSIIRGFASLLVEKPKPMTKQQQGFASEIYENSRRMVRLLESLRLETKVNQNRLLIEPSRQLLNPFLKDLVGEFRLRAKQAGLRLTFSPSKTKLFARFDADATRQILWNILDNACLYTPRGGKIQLIVQQDSHLVTIDIIDTGLGIAASDQPQIFSRFYRGQNAMLMNREGTGLGLAIAKEIAEREQGTISFSSREKEGSRFTLTLPNTPVRLSRK